MLLRIDIFHLREWWGVGFGPLAISDFAGASFLSRQVFGLKAHGGRSIFGPVFSGYSQSRTLVTYEPTDFLLELGYTFR